MTDLTLDERKIVGQLTALLMYCHEQGGRAPTSFDFAAEATRFVRYHLTASAPAGTPEPTVSRDKHPLDKALSLSSAFTAAHPSMPADGSVPVRDDEYELELAVNRYRATRGLAAIRIAEAPPVSPPAVEARDEDTRRLDWLDEQKGVDVCYWDGTKEWVVKNTGAPWQSSPNIRAAIDAARGRTPDGDTP